jgi:DNA polymerase III epsilon subunit-like protein
MSKIAIVDVETTGLDPRHHEIIEIGMVVFDSRTFEITELFEVKIKPERIEDSMPKALAVNGYNEEEWENSASLHDAMLMLAEKSEGAMFCAHNMIFDWMFLSEAENKTGVELPFERHKLDLLTLAWSKTPHAKVHSWSLLTICTYLRIPPEPKMHRALRGALAEYAVYTKLMS